MRIVAMMGWRRGTRRGRSGCRVAEHEERTEQFLGGISSPLLSWLVDGLDEKITTLNEQEWKVRFASPLS